LANSRFNIFSICKYSKQNDCIIFSQKSEIFTLILAANIESVLFFVYYCIAFDINAACPKTVEALSLLIKLHHYLQQHGRYD